MAKKPAKKTEPKAPAKKLYEVTRDSLPIPGFYVRGMKVEIPADTADTFKSLGWVKDA